MTNGSNSEPAPDESMKSGKPNPPTLEDLSRQLSEIEGILSNPREDKSSKLHIRYFGWTEFVALLTVALAYLGFSHNLDKYQNTRQQEVNAQIKADENLEKDRQWQRIKFLAAQIAKIQEDDRFSDTMKLLEGQVDAHEFHHAFKVFMSHPDELTPNQGEMLREFDRLFDRFEVFAIAWKRGALHIGEIGSISHYIQLTDTDAHPMLLEYMTEYFPLVLKVGREYEKYRQK